MSKPIRSGVSPLFTWKRGKMPRLLYAPPGASEEGAGVQEWADWKDWGQNSELTLRWAAASLEFAPPWNSPARNETP
jgi:hypothetical protein